MRRLAVLAFASLCSYWACLPGTATAGSNGTHGGAGVDGSTIAAYVLLSSTDETVASMPGSPGGTITLHCYYYGLSSTGDGDTPGPDMAAGPVWPPVEGDPYYLYCFDGTDLVYGELLAYDPGNPFGALASAEQARDLALSQLDLPLPALALAPPAGDLLVGLPAWYWVDTPWTPQAASATLGGVTATVTAEPVELTFDPGDGAGLVICEGPGVPWTPDREGDPPCGHTYGHHGTYTLTATITWEVAWTATTGAGGPLPDLTTVATVGVEAREVEAVIT